MSGFHTGGDNPKMAINLQFGCQLHFPLRWYIPACLKSITFLLPSCLFMNWTWSLGLWQHLTSHLRPSMSTLYSIKLPLSCYYPIWWLTYRGWQVTWEQDGRPTCHNGSWGKWLPIRGERCFSLLLKSLISPECKHRCQFTSVWYATQWHLV